MGCSSTAPLAYGTSKWVHGHLPIRYKLTSDKWPVNTVDTVLSIMSIAQSGSYAEITLTTSSASTFTALQYVKISGAGIDGYNAVWQIDSIPAADKLVLRAPYLGTTTGSIQKYYNNYAVVAQVYVGIPTGHTFNSQRPIALKGTVRVIPDSSNIAEVAVESFVQSDLSPIKIDICEVLQSGQKVANDYNSWTAFYIAYAETYDESNGTEVSTYTSSFVNDTDGGAINYLYATQSTNQFKDIFGWSAGQYAIASSYSLRLANFMTSFEQPTYFKNFEFDLAIINDLDLLAYETLVARVIEKDSAEATLATTDLAFPAHDRGLYRVVLSEHTFSASTKTFTVQVFKTSTSSADVAVSEIKTANYDATVDCFAGNGIYLRWLSPTGGFDSWLFKAPSDYGIRTGESEVIRRDVTNDWDTNFVNGNTEDDHIYTEAYRTTTVRSRPVNKATANILNRWLRISNKVFQNYLQNATGCGNYENRTVLVDRGDFVVYSDSQNRYEISFSYRSTDQIRLQGQ